MMHRLAPPLAASLLLFVAGGVAAEPPRPPADPACGDRHRQAYDTALKAGGPTAAGLDQALFDAAVCYDDAAKAPAALAAYRELRDRFGKSPLVAQGLLRTARLHARLGQHAEAAAAFEDYARRYPAEADAVAALREAIRHHTEVGADERAIAATKLFVKQYGGKQPAAAAEAFLALVTIYEKRGDAAAVTHLRAYLKTHAARGGDELRLTALARLGEVLWRQSCRVKGVDGACVEVVRPGPKHQQCGAADRLAWKAVARDPRKVKEARATLAEAVALYERAGGKLPGADEKATRHRYAQARFVLAEASFEAVFALAYPTGLDFDPAEPAVAKRSTAAFEAWFKDLDRRATTAAGEYQALLVEVKDPTYAVAATARTGQLASGFVDALLTADVPPFIRAYDEAVDAYCDKLREVAIPHEERAGEAFGVCVRLSTDLGLSTPWADVCTRELARLSPTASSPAPAPAAGKGTAAPSKPAVRP